MSGSRLCARTAAHRALLRCGQPSVQSVFRVIVSAATDLGTGCTVQSPPASVVAKSGPAPVEAHTL